MTAFIILVFVGYVWYRLETLLVLQRERVKRIEDIMEGKR